MRYFENSETLIKHVFLRRDNVCVVLAIRGLQFTSYGDFWVGFAGTVC